MVIAQDAFRNFPELTQLKLGAVDYADPQSGFVVSGGVLRGDILGQGLSKLRKFEINALGMEEVPGGLLDNVRGTIEIFAIYGLNTTKLGVGLFANTTRTYTLSIIIRQVSFLCEL